MPNIDDANRFMTLTTNSTGGTTGGSVVLTPGVALGQGNATISSLGNSTVNSTANVGYTVLTGGVIMQWGTGAAGTAQTFPVAFPTNVFSWSINGQTANVTFSTANSTKIAVTASSGTPVFNYIVLGN